MSKTSSSLPRLVLASVSPRRRNLLSSQGLEFDVLSSDIDENRRPNESPANLVKRLAREKGMAVVNKVRKKNSEALILSADTIVLSPDLKEVFGKPANKAAAAKMLQTLSGKSHWVFTSYCVLHVRSDNGVQKSHSRTIKTRVKMRKLTPEMVEAYVAKGESLDKAGGYAAQGVGGGMLIEQMTGSYTNVVGLPVCQLFQDIERYFRFDYLFQKQLLAKGT